MTAFEIPPSTTTEFVFPSAYGGAARSPNPPQIHDMLGKLRRAVGSVAAKRAAGGPMFPVRGAKELNQKLADALNELGMTAPVVAQEITILPTNDVPKNETKSGNPVFRTLCHCKATVRITAPDTSFIDVVGSGHGGDVDDKSGGKASTYAWKDAIFKGLTIPHEDMVDTDDASSTSEEGSTAGTVAKKGGRPAKTAGGGSPSAEMASVGVSEPSKVAASESTSLASAPSEGPGAGSVDADYVVKQIKAAGSVEQLENIRTAIKSGVLALHGTEKLAASQAFMARMKELKSAAPVQ